MKIKNTLPQIAAILVIIIALASCEEDFSSLGVEVIGEPEVNDIPDESATVISFSRKLNQIQTNGLETYQMGTYNDPVYGKSTVDMVSQVTMSIDSVSPIFGNADSEFPGTVESVFLYIPFFSTASSQDETVTYSNDSIFGGGPLNIAFYESMFFLSTFDPDTNFEENQNYYSDLGEVFDGGANLGPLLGSVSGFYPSNLGILQDSDDPDSVTLAPGLKVALSADFFQEKLLDEEGESTLINNANFKEHFRGLFMDVDAGPDNGFLFLFDMDNAYISINYSFDTEVEDSEDVDGDGNITELIIESKSQEYRLLFSGVIANLYENEFPSEIEAALENPDDVNGEERLYIKGGNGIISVVKLFGEDADENGVADELEELRDKEWLVNEANLIFYVDQNVVTGGDLEPERIIIYNLKDNTVLADYGFDETQGNPDLDAITVHLGRLDRGSDDNGDFYKIKITNHISHLINRDSTNVPLGVIVSQNVTRGGFQDLKEMLESPEITSVPSAAVVSPEGTVLHGNASTDESKRLKLQIFYTEPN